MSIENAVVKVENLTKIYKLYNRPLDLLLETLLNNPRHAEHLVLENLSFKVMPGEVIGIFGRNGAGKSTLLKILAGVLTGSSGSVEVKGKITAILELGTGFHDQYTGRENVYLGGMCLGLTRKEIDSKIDEIITYSELEDSIDNKFQTYSSGMKARLTFSTAAAIDPDVLILDEALAVGDAKFQLKCFSRIRELRERGKTIILVSHSSDTITTFCSRALIIDKGIIYADGEPHSVSKIYHKLLFGTQAINKTKQPESSLDTQTRKPVRYGDRRAIVVEFGILDDESTKVDILTSGDRCILYMKIMSLEDITDWSCGFAIKDVRGTTLWGVTNLSQNIKIEKLQKGCLLYCKVSMSMWLSSGDYFLALGIAEGSDGEKVDFIDDAIHFRVVGPAGFFSTSVVNLDANYSMNVENNINDELA